MESTSNRNDKQDIAISIKGYPIDEVSYTHFLGVYIDNRSIRKKHISVNSDKVSRVIGIVVRIRMVFQYRRSENSVQVIHLPVL